MHDLAAHTKFGFCVWDIPALLVVVLVVGVFVYNSHKLRKKKSELEKQLEELEEEKL